MPLKFLFLYNIERLFSMSRVETGFLPELFGVVNGTYDNSPNHGIDAAPNSLLVPYTSKATCLVTRQGDEVTVTLQINLKAGVTPPVPPVTPNDELRIRATPGINWLPLPNENFNAPIFDVQMFDTVTGNVPAGTLDGVLKARLLGNSLVLVRELPYLVPVQYVALTASGYAINLQNDSYILVTGSYRAA